mgnify:CR=1 FL=1
MNIFKSIYDLFSTNVWAAYFICLGVSLVLGVLLSFAYLRVKKGFVYTKFMPLTIMLIAPIMAALVGLLNVRNTELEASDTIRVGLVLTAGIALTRFRSDKLKIEDMLYLVIASAIGIILGIGYATYGAITTVALILVMLVLHAFKFGEDEGGLLSIRIKVPEELNQDGVFEEIFKEHCQTYALESVRTVEYGQLYELRYDVTLKKGESVKNLVDEVRLHNGNLEVVLSVAERG